MKSGPIDLAARTLEGEITRAQREALIDARDEGCPEIRGTPGFRGFVSHAAFAAANGFAPEHEAVIAAIPAVAPGSAGAVVFDMPPSGRYTESMHDAGAQHHHAW